MFANVGTTKRLWFLLLLVFVLRGGTFTAVYMTNPDAHVTQDSNTYLQLAESLSEHDSFVSAGEPQVTRTPGYPVFIAALAGVGLNRLGIIWIQILLSVLTFLSLYWLGSTIWSKKVGLYAVLIYALDYISFYASQLLLTETLYTFFLMIALGFGVSSLMGGRKHLLCMFLCSLLLAIATLIRPVSYYLIFAIVIGVIVTEWMRTMPWPQILTKTILIVIPWMVIVGGWQYRNYVQAGTTELSLIKGINLMRYRGADIIAQRDGLDLLEAREKFKQDISRHDTMSSVERSESYVDKGIQLMKQHPILAAKGQIKGTVRLLAVPGEGDALRYIGVDSPIDGAFGDLSRLSWGDYLNKWIVNNTLAFFIFVVALGYLIFLYLSVAIGIFGTFRTRYTQIVPHVFLIGVLVYFIVVSAGPYAYPRLRVPVMPILALYSAAGLYFLKTRREDNIG